MTVGDSVFWRRRPCPEDLAEANEGIESAKRSVGDAQRRLEETEQRTVWILGIARRLRDSRIENHYAERIRKVYQQRRGA